jgi:hypothetical protein
MPGFQCFGDCGAVGGMFGVMPPMPAVGPDGCPWNGCDYQYFYGEYSDAAEAADVANALISGGFNVNVRTEPGTPRTFGGHSGFFYSSSAPFAFPNYALATMADSLADGGFSLIAATPAEQSAAVLACNLANDQCIQNSLKAPVDYDAASCSATLGDCLLAASLTRAWPDENAVGTEHWWPEGTCVVILNGAVLHLHLSQNPFSLPGAPGMCFDLPAPWN